MSASPYPSPVSLGPVSPGPVSPVADYEPAPLGGRPGPAPLRPAVGPATAGARTRPAPPPPPDPRAAAAAAFADAALRRVLEVIDRRRPPAQLRPLMAASLADSLMSALGPVRDARRDGAARLRRVRAQPVGARAAEVAARYSRGARSHAVACRIEQIDTPTGLRWQVVALHLG